MIVNDAVIAASGSDDFLSTTITLAFTRPQPIITPGTGPNLEVGRIAVRVRVVRSGQRNHPESLHPAGSGSIRNSAPSDSGNTRPRLLLRSASASTNSRSGLK